MLFLNTFNIVVMLNDFHYCGSCFRLSEKRRFLKTFYVVVNFQDFQWSGNIWKTFIVSNFSRFSVQLRFYKAFNVILILENFWCTSDFRILSE